MRKPARTIRRRLTCLSYMREAKVSHHAHRLAAGVAAIAVRTAVRAMDRLELLERPAGADGDAGQRRLRAVRRHLGLLAQALVEPLQERAPAREHDAAVHDVRRE